MTLLGCTLHTHNERLPKGQTADQNSCHHMDTCRGGAASASGRAGSPGGPGTPRYPRPQVPPMNSRGSIFLFTYNINRTYFFVYLRYLSIFCNCRKNSIYVKIVSSVSVAYEIFDVHMKLQAFLIMYNSNGNI